MIVTSRNECRDELRSLMVADEGSLAEYALLKVHALSARQCKVRVSYVYRYYEGKNSFHSVLQA